ncbi:MAG: ABC transporter permease [Treponemataceae bacterium]
MKKEFFPLRAIRLAKEYRFLLEQLVARDFKTKYKRSVLGVFWSFLNPLLTMAVQYIVFSRIFNRGDESYFAYLLSGIVFFSFFSETTTMGLVSITGNAPLLRKVYIPKSIFPIARILSSSINLSLSLIPLFLVCILTGVKIQWTIIFFPGVIFLLMVFCLGMSFFLSAAMVFFRDLQFLWGVVVLLWMYATPIFYPESIIPQKFDAILLLNPMRHFLRFGRNVLINGVLPPPSTFIYCMIFSFGMFALGLFVFRKTQNKFVLNL